MRVISVTGLLFLLLLSACGGEDDTIAPPDPDAPVLDPIGDQSVVVFNLLQFQLSATDPAQENVTFSVSPGSFSGNLSGSGAFNWTPGMSDIQIHDVTFVATNESGLSDSESITITVAESEGEELYTTNCVRSGCHSKISTALNTKGCVQYGVNEIIDNLPGGATPVSAMSGISLNTSEISAIAQYTFDTFADGCP